MTRRTTKQKKIEEALREEFKQTLPERVNRSLQIDPNISLPPHHFVFSSLECGYLFRDGYYYGCILLVQAVAEAIVRFLCKKNGWNPVDEFEKNVKKLFSRGSINEELKEHFLKIWEKRNDYHHLNFRVIKDSSMLNMIALEKIGLLTRIENEIFAYNLVIADDIKAKYPKYWELEQDMKEFLKTEEFKSMSILLEEMF